MQLLYSKSFLKDIKRLRERNILLRVEEIILSLKQANNFSQIVEAMPIKKLVGSTGYYRLRINNYRLGIFLSDDDIITVLRFGHRKDFYEGFP